MPANQTVDPEDIAELIERCKLSTSVSEFHGSLVGYISAGGRFPHGSVLEALQLEPDPAPSADEQAMLGRLRHQTEMWLADTDLTFGPWLPEEDAPLAARAGLDWALSHALDEPAAKSSLQWSSTGVTPHFDIKVSARIKGGDAGLGKVFAAASCRRFELAQTGSKASYPGIACRNSAGDWVLPGSGVSIARPAGHAGHTPSLRSAAK